MFTMCRTALDHVQVHGMVPWITPDVRSHALPVFGAWRPTPSAAVGPALLNIRGVLVFRDSLLDGCERLVVTSFTCLRGGRRGERLKGLASRARGGP